MKPVLAAGHWRTNGEMIADVARLYFHHGDRVLDCTFGEGGFWTNVDLELLDLVGTDINPAKCYGTGRAMDFRALAYANGEFDVTVFDPAYVSTGGRGTSTLTSMIDEYAMHSTEKSPKLQWENVILPGLAECVRVTAKPRRRTKTQAGRKGGVVLFKVSNYISSGSFHNFQRQAADAFDQLGLRMTDQFIYTRQGAGPQPGDRTRKCAACKGTGVVELPDPAVPEAKQQAICGACNGDGKVLSNQQHARNNVSYLMVGRKR